ncbi:MAG TPA: GxxExxY protein [Flavobacteriales bacterium]|nr:GxxExxY protein [Flavobacteriales bacterium]
MNKKDLDQLHHERVGAVIEVHKNLGFGLLESVYQKCLVHELRRGHAVQSECVVKLKYKGLDLDTELKCDLLVDEKIDVELKSGEAMWPVHEAQLLTCMRILEKPRGLLINFNCTI